MTGLEPHPMFALPTREQVLALEKALGREEAATRINALIADRRRRIEAERNDPQGHGFRPPIWHVADELLTDGKEVVLVDPAWDIEDPQIRRIRPPDFLAEAVRRKQLGLGPIVIIGRRELWIAGSNRSSKTEYAAYKIDDIGTKKPHARTWSWSDSEEKSQAKQQPVIFKYLPAGWKNLLNAKGKARDREMKMGFGPDGFVGNRFSAANGWKHWFNNYKQDLRDVEGDQLDASWHDEERDPERVKTVRVRLGDRGGIMLVTFTSIDATFMAIVSEYETGMQVLLEVEAEWLPKQRPAGIVPYEKECSLNYEKVRRVAVAGPGSDGDQKANILYFHIADNPYYGYDPNAVLKPGSPPPIYGKRAFYETMNIRTATRTKILSRGYGILTRGALQQFRYNAAIHLVEPSRIPKEGTRFHILDPCPGRNWFMIWILIDRLQRWFIYREWPSYGGNWPSAYIPGIGEPGAWALAGTRGDRNNKIIYDGIKGPAQDPFRFGLTRYKEEIERLEGREVVRRKEESHASQTTADRGENGAGLAGDKVKRITPRNPLFKKQPAPANDGSGEVIAERWMDSRYAGTPTVGKEAATTQIEQMAEAGMDFLAAPSEQNILTRDDGSIAMVNELLDYDDEVELGEYSPRLARLNESRLFVSRECPNVAFALKEWTGKDGQHGACKDPADCIRYAALCDLDYIGDNAYSWGKY